MAYDSARGVVVLFGGAYRESNQWHYLNDTWEWDGSSWDQVSSSEQIPQSRCRHAMAYDSERSVVVMFGGYYRDNQLGSQLLSDSWEWDGESWRQVSLEGPSARNSHAMAYDSTRGFVVLFGGYNFQEGGQYLNDTWEYLAGIEIPALDGPIMRADEEGVTLPELIYRVEPDYPDRARRARRSESLVILQAIVNTRGEVVFFSVLDESPSGYGFADKAVDAVSQWRFRPAIYNGRPVNVIIGFVVEFDLRY